MILYREISHIQKKNPKQNEINNEIIMYIKVHFSNLLPLLFLLKAARKLLPKTKSLQQ